MNNSSENTKKEFARVLRGYAPNEVDEYIASLKKDIDGMSAYISELENKVQYLSRQNNALKQTNATPKYILDEAREMGAKIIDNANEEAAIIIGSAKTSCDNLLNEFRFRMGEEKKKLIQLAVMVQEFKSDLYVAYQKHIDDVESVTDTVDIDALKLDADAYSQKVVADIKTEVAYLTAELKQRQERESENSIEDEYFANREAELEAELASENENKENEKTNVFNPDIDLSDFPDTPDDGVTDDSKTEDTAENNDGVEAENTETPVVEVFETEDDMTVVDSSVDVSNDSVPVFDDFSSQTDDNEFAEEVEIPITENGDVIENTESEADEAISDMPESSDERKSIFPEPKIPDLIYPSPKSKKKKKSKKSEAAKSYDDILESFAKELGEENKNN